MKKIINFFKNLFKLIIGFFGEYVSSKSKVKTFEIKKEVEKIEKELKYISVVGSLPDDDPELSIYEERLEYLKKNNKVDKELKIIIEKMVVLIKEINNKKEKDNSLYEYILVTTELLDSYYEDYNYFMSSNRLEYLPSLNEKVSKVLKDYYKKEKELDFASSNNETKKIDKYGLLKSENKITELLAKTKLMEMIENRETVLDKKDIKEKKISRNIFPLEEIKHDDKKEIKEEIKNIEIKPGNKIEEKKTKEENKSETKEANKEKLKSDIEEISKSIKLINSYIDSNDKLVKNKKKKGLKELYNQTARIGLSFFPMALFKNKVIGALTSVVILNNTIRSMRRSLNSDVEYIKLTKDDYLTNGDMISKTEQIKGDVLNQILLLKSEIRTEYIVTNDIELLTMYNELENLELEFKKKEEKEKAKIKIKTNKY